MTNVSPATRAPRGRARLVVGLVAVCALALVVATPVLTALRRARDTAPASTSPGRSVPAASAPLAGQVNGDVAIEVYSANGFPVRDAGEVLRVGAHDFMRASRKPGTNTVLVFTLTAVQFDQLGDGDPVTFRSTSTATPERFFGRLNKGQPHLTEDLRAAIQYGRDQIAMAKAATTDRYDTTRLDAAIQELDAALAAALWAGPAHPSATSGAAIFRRLQGALTQLGQVRQEETLVRILPLLEPYLLRPARGMAATALDEARAAGADQATVSKIQATIDGGDDAVLNERHAAALEHYRLAWEQALQARTTH